MKGLLIHTQRSVVTFGTSLTHLAQQFLGKHGVVRKNHLDFLSGWQIKLLA
jgi:hypothetical protein